MMHQLLFVFPCKEKILSEEEWDQLVAHPDTNTDDNFEWSVVMNPIHQHIYGKLVCSNFVGLEAAKRWVDKLEGYDYFRVAFLHYYAAIQSDQVLDLLTRPRFGFAEIGEAAVYNMDFISSNMDGPPPEILLN